MRNHVTKLNKKKKKLHYETKVNYIKNDIANRKISTFRHDIPATNADTTHPSISDQIMEHKHCKLKFRKESVEEVKKMIVVYQQLQGHYYFSSLHLATGTSCK